MRDIKFMVNPTTFAVAAFVAAVCLGYSFLMAFMGRIDSTVGFGAVGIVFMGVSAINGAIVTVGETGISRKLLFFPPHVIAWKDVREVGVCGTKLFPKTNKNKVGTRYIYISPRCLDDESRFGMVLRWPPKEQIYLSYTRERMDQVQLRWGGKIEEYNAGNIGLTT